MSASVSIGMIQIGSATNQVGIFSGQNMQNNWDSHAPTISATGDTSGNYNVTICQYAMLWNQSALGQATFDQDAKLNGSPLAIGP